MKFFKATAAVNGGFNCSNNSLGDTVVCFCRKRAEVYRFEILPDLGVDFLLSIQGGLGMSSSNVIFSYKGIEPFNIVAFIV